MVEVLRACDFFPSALEACLSQLAVTPLWIPDGAAIPGSYWGAPEAGIHNQRLMVRQDTPLHSLLHEAGHLACANLLGRHLTVSDSGSDDEEECAVCYLQVLLTDSLPPPASRERLFADMNAWGYSFRQGSAERWFHGDGEDARRWLADRGLISANGTLNETHEPAIA
jgi:hypothetical protein